jgi:hypothetical protein
MKGAVTIEIEGFDEIISILALAKELHDIDRYDVVEEQFFDSLSFDSFYENIIGIYSSIFSGFYNDCNDDDGEEFMLLTDDYISRYYEIAWEYGRINKVRHDGNPYVIEAQDEVRRWLGTCHSIGWKLLGYTKTNKAAKQSKLIVYITTCDCNNYEKLGFGLIQLYKFFMEKCDEYDTRIPKLTASTVNINRKDVIAA